MEEDFVSMHREILELAMQREKLCDQMFQRVMRELDSGIITYDEAMERVKVIDEEKAKAQHILDLQQDLLDRTKIKGKDGKAARTKNKERRTKNKLSQYGSPGNNVSHSLASWVF